MQREIIHVWLFMYVSNTAYIYIQLSEDVQLYIHFQHKIWPDLGSLLFENCELCEFEMMNKSGAPSTTQQLKGRVVGDAIISTLIIRW